MESDFVVMQAEREGLPALIVIDQGLNRGNDARDFPYLVRIELPISSSLANGLCGPEENARLNALEDRLLERIEGRSWCYAGRTTWRGKRTILLYSAAPEELTATLREVVVDGGPELAVRVRHEPEWATWRSLAPK